MSAQSPSRRSPPAIVLNLDCITGLQTARILTYRGVPVIGVAKNPGHFCCRTNVCDSIVYADTESEALIDTLLALGPQLPAKAVLFPCADATVLLLSRHRHRLAAWYHLLLPPHEVVELLMDKLQFYTFAQGAGLPIPPTRLLHSRADAEAAAQSFTFPCVLKPSVKTPEWLEHGGAKVFKVSSPQELLAVYDRCARWARALMLQVWVEGTDADLYSCNVYFNASSEPLVTFVARKIRQWPPEAGTSCLGEECRNDEVLEATVRLFRAVGYCGLGYMEMKRDSRTGRHYIIEPNVGRPTGRSAIAEAGGVELLYTQYCDALGWPLPKNREQQYTGVKWIYLRRDIQSALHYWRRGELSLGQWWLSWRGRKGYAVFSWRDPGPFVHDLLKSVGRLEVPRTARPTTPVAEPG